MFVYARTYFYYIYSNYEHLQLINAVKKALKMVVDKNRKK